MSDPTITYGTSSVIVSGTLESGSQAPVGESVAVTLDGIEQSATIGSGGAFSTTFNTTGLTVANSPDTIAYCVYQRRDLRLRQHHQHADGQAGAADGHGHQSEHDLRRRSADPHLYLHGAGRR